MQTSSGLILPDDYGPPLASEMVEPELMGMTLDEAESFLAGNAAIQRDMKKAKKAFARLQATIRHEAQALARSRGQRIEA